MFLKHGNTVSAVEIKPLDGRTDDRAWIDVASDSADDVASVLRQLGWDPLLGRELAEDTARARLEYRGDLLILSIFVAEGDDLKRLDIAVGPHTILTRHHGPLTLIEDLERDVPSKPGLLESAHYLLYEIMERVGDGFLERMDAYEEQFDQLEEEILDGQDRARAVFSLRRKLHGLRGVLADMRRIAARLSRRQFSGEDSNPAGSSLFVDVYDSLYHVMDNIDSLRDNLTGLVDLQLNQRSTRLNEIMKFLTIFSTIFLPITFVTGFFGMNLRSMPELGVPYGQEYTILFMLAIAVGMLYVFRRRGWF